MQTVCNLPPLCSGTGGGGRSLEGGTAWKREEPSPLVCRVRLKLGAGCRQHVSCILSVLHCNTCRQCGGTGGGGGSALVLVCLQDAVEEVPREADAPEGDADGQEERALVLKHGGPRKVRVRDVRRPGTDRKGAAPLRAKGGFSSGLCLDVTYRSEFSSS